MLDRLPETLIFAGWLMLALVVAGLIDGLIGALPG